MSIAKRTRASAGLLVREPIPRRELANRAQADSVRGNRERELGLRELLALSTQAFTYPAHCRSGR